MAAIIQPSPELTAVLRRWNDAMREKNGAALANMLSRSEHLRYQGTADNETWSGQVFRRRFPDHVAEIPDYAFHEDSLEAFKTGRSAGRIASHR